MENPRKNGVSYEFDAFSVDAEQCLLFRDGEPVPLAPKVVETLVALVEHRGRVMTKDELMERLWPDTFVEQSNLSQNVFLLRKALGEAEYIETVPRRGYCFRGEVRRLGPADGDEVRSSVPADDGGELIHTSRTRTRFVREEEVTIDGTEATFTRPVLARMPVSM